MKTVLAYSYLNGTPAYLNVDKITIIEEYGKNKMRVHVQDSYSSYIISRNDWHKIQHEG